MFYAERHSCGANMRLSTNIKIVDTETLTTKGMYAHTIGGLSKVDSATGMGEALKDNTLVNIGDTIAYSFDILNIRDVPVSDLSFVDHSLGTDISKDQIILSDPELANGAVTNITDIGVYYRTYDEKTVADETVYSLNSEAPVKVAYTDMQYKLEAAVAQPDGTDTTAYGTLDEGSYWVAIENVQQLRRLLELGIPKRCQMSVYGFKRNTVKSDTPYTNTVDSVCYYPRDNGENGDTELIPISGSASRIIQVPDIDKITLPTADPEEIVIDYGKAVEIPLTELRNHIYSNRSVTVGEFVGLTDNGRHCEFLREAPTSWGCKTVSATFPSMNGVYTRLENKLVFQPNQFLSSVEKVYAIYALSECYGLTSNGTSVAYPYMLIELRIIPATLMYYEAEDFTIADNKLGGEITTVDVSGKGSSESWGTASDGTDLLDINEDSIPDSAFYVDFDGEGFEKRYRDNPIYDGCDLDSDAYWTTWSDADGNKTPPVVDSKNGTLSTAMAVKDGVVQTGSIYLQSGHHLARRYFLNIVPQDPMWLQLRFKLENFKATEGKTPTFSLGYYTDLNRYEDYYTGDTIRPTGSYKLKANEYSGEYVTIKVPVSFGSAKTITALRPQFYNLTSVDNAAGKLTIDYIYVGPEPTQVQDFDRVADTVYDMVVEKESIPQDAFFVDFDGEGYDDRYRDNPVYGRVDFDQAESWRKNDSCVKDLIIDHKAGTMTMDITNLNTYSNRYVQTVFGPESDFNDVAPLRLKPGERHFLQIRFKVENCEASSVNNVPTLKVYFSSDLTANIRYDDPETYVTLKLDPEELFSGKYITVRYPLDKISYYTAADYIDAIRFQVEYVKSAAQATETDPGRIVVDYLYVGADEGFSTKVQQDPKLEDSGKYLFFDFTNTAADRLRYQDPQYNGFNFDLVDNWKGRTYGWNDGTQSLENGALTVQAVKTGYVSIYADSAVANGDNTRLLDYDPSHAEVFQIRFKASNLHGNENTCARVQFYTDTSTSYLSSNDAKFDLKYLTNGEYVTVTGTITPEMRRMERIRRIIVWIGNMDGTKNDNTGTVTYDHVYIGPRDMLEQLNRDRSYLYFTFDNTVADQYRYDGRQYNGFNFDLADSWVGRTTSWTDGTDSVSEGAITVKAATTGYSSIYVDSAVANFDNTRLFNYDPTNAEVFQIRFKASNLYGKTATTRARVQFYQDTSKTFVSSNGAEFDLKYLQNDQYITVTGTITDDMRKMECIRRIVVWVGGLDETQTTADGTVTYDHVYIGPRDILEQINEELEGETIQEPYNYLYFGFENTIGDKYRYSNPVYNNCNFDLVESWKRGTNGSDPTITPNGALTFHDTNESIFTGADAHLNNLWIGTQSKLAYTPHKDDHAVIRLKIDSAASVASHHKAEFRIDYYDDNGNSGSSQTVAFKLVDYVNRGYFTLKVPMNGENDVYANTDFFSNLHLVLRETNGATVTIDYLYIGPLERAVPVSNSLYFGYDNDPEDQARYNCDSYGYRNYDTAYWVEGSASVDSIVVKPDAGYVELSVNQLTNDKYLQTSGAADFNDFSCIAPLDYHPSHEDVVQIRFRAENMTSGLPYASFGLVFLKDGEETDVSLTSANWTAIPNELLASGSYITVTAALDDAFRNASTIGTIRPVLRGVNVKSGDSGRIFIDYCYIGPEANAPTVYGYDSSYTSDPLYSNGESLFVEGKGVRLDPKAAELNSYTYPDAYTETTFRFKGTGFDIIGRTDKQQATIRVGVYTDPNFTQESCQKVLTVNCKGELDLYQIPVASIQGLPYGTYYVKIGVNKAITKEDLPVIPNVDLSGLLRGNQFYFDAVRIYDPIDVTGATLTEDQQIALNAYESDKEAYNYIKEIRNILLSAETFEGLTDLAEGCVFIDVKSSLINPDGSNNTTTYPGDIDDDDYITADVQTYNKIGPKNEVYLAPQQAIAFRLAVDSKQALASLDIGAKTISQHSSAELAIGLLTKNANGETQIVVADSYQVSTATAQYYEIRNNAIDTAAAEHYLVIYNRAPHTTENTVNGENVISITDVKAAYGTDPDTEPLPDDQLTDPEIMTEPTESTQPSSVTPAGEEEARPETKSTGPSAPVRFLVDQSTLEAARSFVKALSETPVEQEPTLVGGIRIYHNLNLASDISVNYLIPVAELVDYDSFCLEVLTPTYEGNSYVADRTYRLEAVEKDGYYYFTLKGLTAVQMNDCLKATLCMSREGKHFRTEADLYSVAQYAYAQLNKTTVKDELKTLCADLLRYGSAAQSFKGYRTDSLADAAMTEEHKTYLSSMEAVTFGNTNTLVDDCPSDLATWVGKSLNLESKVTLRFVLDLSSYVGDPSDLSLRVSYTDLDGQAVTAEIRDLAAYGSRPNAYSFDFDGLLAAELRTEVRAALYAGQEQISDTLTYTADTYGRGKEGTLGTLCRALLAYSDSAKAFFQG